VKTLGRIIVFVMHVLAMGSGVVSACWGARNAATDPLFCGSIMLGGAVVVGVHLYLAVDTIYAVFFATPAQPQPSTPTPPEPPPSDGVEHVQISLNQQQTAKLIELAKADDMTPGEWIVACIEDEHAVSKEMPSADQHAYILPVDPDVHLVISEHAESLGIHPVRLVQLILRGAADKMQAGHATTQGATSEQA